MSSISGIDSSSVSNALLSYLSKLTNADSSQSTETDAADTEQTTSDSTITSKISLADQLKISSLQNQCSLMTSLFNSTSSDLQNSFWEDEETTDNSQLTQLLAALNSSSSSSSEANDLITGLLQSLDGSNSDSLQTAAETLLKLSGSDVDSEILNQYLSLLTGESTQIKTTA